MKRICKEIIALPHDASLDLLGAARALSLLHPKSVILHPVRLAQNAWEIARTSSWFKSVSLNEIDWTQVQNIYLVDITLPKQNPELIDQLSHLSIRTFLISHRPPRLPFHPKVSSLKGLSLTTNLVAKLKHKNISISKEDAKLFLAAITERTWAGLAHKVTKQDAQISNFLKEFGISTKQIANSIVLGMRDGQAGLYREMLKRIEDFQAGYWPITMIIVKTIGQVQDIEPIIDALWSDLSPVVLLIGVSTGKFCRIWARSSIAQIDLFSMFRKFRPRRERRWTCFSIQQKGILRQKNMLKSFLKANLKSEKTAGEIMSVSPRCIDKSETVKNALEIMLMFNIMSLVVLENNKFSGVLTRRDLDRAIKMDLMDSEIGQYVPTNCPTVEVDTPIRVIKNIMVRFNLTKIPVLDQRRIAGIITSRELLRALPDYLPMPHDYLPLAKPAFLPQKNTIEKLLKRLFSLKVFRLLERIGTFAETKHLQAFAVGGFVRDLLLEKKNLDIDIVLLGDATKFAQALSKELECEFKVFDRFHTSRIYYEDMKIDFSSARIEHYSSPGALPQVEFSGLSNDLFRRDFSINSLALNLNPDSFLQIIDFFGGYQDMQKKQIRILHPFSFLEDPTRLFRALRFSKRFSFKLEKDTKRAFDQAIQRESVMQLSKKRIGTEIKRCLKEESPYRIIEELFESKLMKYLDNRLTDTSILPSRFRLVPGLVRRFNILEEEIDQEAILWAGLLSVLTPSEAGKIMDSLGTPAKRKKIIVQSLEGMAKIPEQLAKIEIQNNLELYNLLTGQFLESLIALIAFSLDKISSKKVLYYIGNLRNISCAITGKDLIAAGLPPGAHIRIIFQQIQAEKLQGKSFTKQEEMDFALKSYKNLQIQ